MKLQNLILQCDPRFQPVFLLTNFFFFAFEGVGAAVVVDASTGI